MDVAQYIVTIHLHAVDIKETTRRLVSDVTACRAIHNY